MRLVLPSKCRWSRPQAVAARMRRPKEGRTDQLCGLDLVRQPTFAGASVVAARRSNADRHCPVDNHPFRDDRPRWEASPAEDGRVPLTSLPPGTTLDQLQQVASLFTTIFTTTFTVLLFRSPAHLHLLHHHLDPHHAQITLCSAVLVFYDLCMRLPVSHLAADRLPKQARQ